MLNSFAFTYVSVKLHPHPPLEDPGLLPGLGVPGILLGVLTSSCALGCPLAMSGDAFGCRHLGRGHGTDIQWMAARTSCSPHGIELPSPQHQVLTLRNSDTGAQPRRSQGAEASWGRKQIKLDSFHSSSQPLTADKMHPPGPPLISPASPPPVLLGLNSPRRLAAPITAWGRNAPFICWATSVLPSASGPTPGK